MSQLKMSDVFTDSDPAPVSRFESGATFSSCRRWRYHLWRSWGDRENRVAFIGLNGSKAGEVDSDHTVTKCIRFAKRWEFDGYDMLNLFGWMSTDPRGLRDIADPIGPDNDETILRVCSRARRVVIAWGSHACVKRMLAVRADAVRRLLADCQTPVGHLGLCKDGHPRHPLMLAYATQFQPTLWSQIAPMLVLRDVASRTASR